MPTLQETLAASLTDSETYFNRSTSVLDEKHSAYTPVESTYTVAQHVAHVALTIEWFFLGAFGTEGFDLDFERHDRDARSFSSLATARQRLTAAFEGAREELLAASEEDLRAPLPEGPVMGGAPRLAIIASIEEHTAHHRGALSVYSRLQGLTPPMPYLGAC